MDKSELVTSSWVDEVDCHVQAGVTLWEEQQKFVAGCLWGSPPTPAPRLLPPASHHEHHGNITKCI